MKKFFLAFTFTLSFFLLSAQTSAFEITYNQKIITTQTGDLETVSIGDNSTLTTPYIDKTSIILQKDNSFVTISNSSNLYSFFDFTNEQIIKYNNDTFFDITPLYHIIDYRIAEYENRSFLSEMLQESGAGNVFGNFANNESIFGIEIKKNKVSEKITSTINNDTITYTFENASLGKIHYSTKKISKKYLTAFSKYLIYNLELHPSIKEEIIKTNLIPDYIQLQFQNVGTTTTKTFHLTEAKSTKIDKNINFKTKVSPEKNTSQMNHFIDYISIHTFRQSITLMDSSVYFEKTHRLSENGKHLSALLCLLDYLLATGEQPTKQIQEVILPNQQSDTLLATFLYCLNSPTSKEDAESKISTLNYLISLDLEYGYVMNIFAANYSTQIDKNKSILYFQEALSNNPFITGAWLDLGKIYASQYRYDTAWKCFDIMLQIEPNHPMAKEITDKKAFLKDNYPNYFKAQ